MSEVFPVDLGDVPNDGTGDPLRVAFAKINDNFNYLSNLAPNGPEGAVQFIRDGVSGGTANLVYNEVTGNLDISVDTVPLTDLVANLGAPANRFAHLYLGNSGITVGNITASETGNVLSFTVPNQSQTLPASLSAKNFTATGNIQVNGTITVGNRETGLIEVITPDDSANQIVFEVPVLQFDNGTFQITTKNLNNADSQRVTLDILKATSNVALRFIAHQTIFSGGPLTRYNADVAYGNVRVMVSPMVDDRMQHNITYTINT